MFEEVCLVCGRHLRDNGRAYCSSDCENVDISSPCISSASSALSSPYLGHTAGGEVPALPPSALGAALKKHRTRDRYSISSSSASSASWSVPTDDEGEEPVLGIGTEYNQVEGIEQIHEVNTKSTLVWSAALSYARLPSGTNNRSTVPHVHKRTASGSPSHVHSAPRSAPMRYHLRAEEEEGHSDFGFSSRDSSDSVEINHHPVMGKLAHPTTKSKRARNRASLPACFSLLQISNPANETRPSPVSSSSGHTIARTSPPTPKLVLSTGMAHSPALASNLAEGDNVQVTPRGRRRIPENRRSGDSASPSGSRPRIHYDVPYNDMLIGLSSGAAKTSSNWPSDPSATRGRNAFKRNMSPPPPKAYSDGRSSTKTKTRGRLRIDELDGFSPEAPGYGHGRSGLVDRERVSGTRPTLHY